MKNWPLAPLTLAASLLATSATAQELRLVEDGKPSAVIVLPAPPSGTADFSAKILNSHIRQMSGASLRVVREKALGVVTVRDGRITTENDVGATTFVLLGASKPAAQLGVPTEDLAPGEIVMRSFPNALVLLGADRATPSDQGGTRYAVTSFLEDALGLRFLWPGELGKVIPKRTMIDVPPIDHRFAPMLRQRQIRMASGYGDRKAEGCRRLGITREQFEAGQRAAFATVSPEPNWARWHRLGGTLNLTSGHSYGHAWETYGKEHPEWFAMAPNGSRDQSASPHRARLCVSNADLAAAIARMKIARIEETGQRSVSIGPNDGGTTSFCTCPACEALDAPTDRRITLIDFSPGANRRPFEHVPLTDRYVHFYNAIAERVTAVHPDVWLTADAYSAYAAPPVRAKLHPNVAIRYVGVTYTDDERRARDLDDWEAWAKAANKIYFRSNLLLAGRRQGIPVVYVHKLAEDFRRIAPNRMIGTDLDSCCHNWATQGLNYYVMAKLLWDPNLDVDTLIADYCQAGFGAGAESVAAYFQRVEELTNQIAQGKRYTEPYTPEVLAELRAILDRAAEATRGDEATSQRVAFLHAGLDHTDAYCAIFQIESEWRQSGGGHLTPEYRERFRVACDHNRAIARETFLQHHLAVNAPTVAWGSWAYFGRFGWNAPKK